MRTRVVRRGDRYYPEQRWMLLWFRFTDDYVGCCQDISFPSLDKALNFLAELRKPRINQVVWTDEA